MNIEGETLDRNIVISNRATNAKSGLRSKTHLRNHGKL